MNTRHACDKIAGGNEGIQQPASNEKHWIPAKNMLG